jgi:glycerol transport system ATP-binding protein
MYPGIPAGNTEMSLVFEGISKIVKGEVHIHPMDLELAPGSFNVLLGHTRAGKTTLLRLMAGLDRPSSGSVSMNGGDVTRRSVRRRNVAMVYQDFINYPNFTVFDNVASPLKVAGMDRMGIDRRVREVVDMLHLEDCLQRLPSELSGGQQQRTALARALVKDADLLLLDEPLVNLDYKLREELRFELRNIFRMREAIIVYATAEPQEALALGGNTLVVDEGRVIQQGNAAAVYHRPKSVRSAQVLSDPPMNIVTGRLTDTDIQLGEDDPVPKPEHLRALPNGPYQFGVRPNHVLTSRRSSADIQIRTRVELAEISGSETSIHLEHNALSWVSRQDGIHSLDVGETVHVYIEPHRILAFDSRGTLVAAPEHPSARPLN